MTGFDLPSLAKATFVQAARAVQVTARRIGKSARVGHDALPEEEPVRFVSSQRLSLPLNDVSEAGQDESERIRLTANVMGLAGSTAALPPPYSELQLERRRARDPGFSEFLNLFDHRALSFFYRIAEKYSWPLLAERTGPGETDPICDLLLSLGGLAPGFSDGRLDLLEQALVPLNAHLADTRRAAANVETVLRIGTGLDLRVVEAHPTWMAVPPSQQSRIGGTSGQLAQLGSANEDGHLGASESAMLGAAVLDVQHHYLIEIGPLSYDELKEFCREPESRRVMTQLAVLAGGFEHRPLLRLLIEETEIPPLSLGQEHAPALLGWTTWLGQVERPGGVSADCVIPIDPLAIN